MATSGEGSNPSGRAMPRPLAQLKVLEPRVARRRLSQARHRATLAGLFSNLRKAVYFHSDLTASKVWGPEGREEKLPHTEGLRSQGGDTSGTLWVQRESWAVPACCRQAWHQKGNDGPQRPGQPATPMPIPLRAVVSLQQLPKHCNPTPSTHTCKHTHTHVHTYNACMQPSGFMHHPGPSLSNRALEVSPPLPGKHLGGLQSLYPLLTEEEPEWRQNPSALGGRTRRGPVLGSTPGSLSTVHLSGQAHRPLTISRQRVSLWTGACSRAALTQRD